MDLNSIYKNIILISEDSKKVYEKDVKIIAATYDNDRKDKDNEEKCNIYIRVSTSHQIDKDSLPMQRNDMINYSKYVLNIEDYEVFEDAGFSGKNTMRPAFQNMMKRIKEGEFSYLLVWKIDRVSRNLIDFCEMYEDLKKYNCIFISKNEQFDTSSAMGETMLKIVLVFAELERKLTAERVTATMIDRATKGLWNGAPIPLGYRWDENLKFPVIDPKEKETIELIYSSYIELKSTNLVKKLLDANDIKTKKNASWTTKTIGDIIRNPFYKGTYRYNFRESSRGKIKNENEWILIEDNHDSIISEELWKECNDIMDINAQKSNAVFRSNTRTHIFSSMVCCLECGGNMYGKQDKPHRDGFRPGIYTCSNRYVNNSCNQKTISEKVLGEFIFNLISNIIKASTFEKLTESKLNKILLSGLELYEIKTIKNIDELLNAIKLSDKNSFEIKRKKIVPKEVSKNKKIEAEIKKYSIALNKLEELYLFDENQMSTKDYISKKNKITQTIIELQEELNNLPPTQIIDYDINFIMDVLTLEISKELKKGNINLKKIILNTNREILKDFSNSILNKTYVLNKKIGKIESKNRIYLLKKSYYLRL